MKLPSVQVDRVFDKGHQADIVQIMPFVDHLISFDEDNVLNIWDIETGGMRKLTTHS